MAAKTKQHLKTHFELTREYLDKLIENIEADKEVEVFNMIKDLHAADIAEIYDELNIDQARFIYLMLDDEKAADVVIELEEDDRRRFLDAIPVDKIARQFIDNMDSDDAADILGELSNEKVEEIISHIGNVEQASAILDLLKYDEDTAGGLMGTELVSVNENWSLVTCIKEIRKQAVNIDEIYYVYVTDNDNILRGTLSLKRLLLANSAAKVKNISNSDVIFVKTDTPSEEVANVMNKYDLVTLPVVDPIGRLKGRITIDDVVDVIREEAEKDYQLVSGITADHEPFDNVWRVTRARLPWLFIGLVGGILGASVIGNYEDQLRLHPEMAFFIPLIAAMAGNVGVQSSSIIVQGLANNSIGLDSSGRKLLNELGVALINGIILSATIFIYNFFVRDTFALTVTVSVALLTVVIFASMFGTFIPLALNKFKVDPAVATGPFITTLNDIMGLFVYLLIGRLMYGIF